MWNGDTECFRHGTHAWKSRTGTKQGKELKHGLIVGGWNLWSLDGDEATGLPMKRRVESSGLQSCILPLFEAGTDSTEVEKLVASTDLQTVHGMAIPQSTSNEFGRKLNVLIATSTLNHTPQPECFCFFIHHFSFSPFSQKGPMWYKGSWPFTVNRPAENKQRPFRKKGSRLSI